MVDQSENVDQRCIRTNVLVCFFTQNRTYVLPIVKMAGAASRVMYTLYHMPEKLGDNMGFTEYLVLGFVILSFITY